MYDPLTKFSGIAAVNNYLSPYTVGKGPDGLSLEFDESKGDGAGVVLPQRLKDWLLGLRLLRDIPLAYLVPDAALLPPESIRFFHVDPTWVDRVIDGVFAAANTGTVDLVFGYRMLQASRNDLDETLTGLAKKQVASTEWEGGGSMTGMLIRSELVRRWPDLIIRAYENTNPPPAPDPNDPPPPTVALLRGEPISKDIYIALFAGEPGMVHVREPNVGTRYGVEPKGGGGYKVDARKPNGETPEDAPAIDIAFRSWGLRIINLSTLAYSSNQAEYLGDGSPRQVALDLEQLPYVQEFKNTVEERRGSKDPALLPEIVELRRGRKMSLKKLKDRQTDLDALGS